MKIFKKETSEDKLKSEIESTEFKKNSLLNSVNAEKADLLAKKRAKFEILGESVYNSFISGEKPTESNDIFEEIKNLEVEIENRNLKHKEIETRYNEEIQMLSSNLAVQIQNATNASAGGNSTAQAKFCSNCGNKATKDDAFCQNCGSKIE